MIQRERDAQINTTKATMCLRKTIHRTKNFFHKTLQNLKSFLFGDYQKLPKSPPFNPFSSSSNQKMQQLDNFYREFSEHWESDRDEAMQKRKKKKKKKKKKKNSTIMSVKEAKREENESSGSFMNYETMQNIVMNTKEEGEREENKPGSYHEGKRGDPCSQSDNGGGHVLAQKMKEIEMMDLNDVDHVLDIEEVLHYYSRLTSPVYLDLVDKFFMEMYSEFLLPQPSLSANNSMRRLGPMMLQ